jgi:anthranilate synthase component I
MIVERYSHVMHIVSNVVGTLGKGYDALDLFAASFPAGTVTGTPKIRAMQIIDTLEPTARGYYAGSVAHIDFDGDMDSCIILRCVVAVNGRAYWQASAGIVADSDPLLEYDEVLHKTRVVRHVLGLDEAPA